MGYTIQIGQRIPGQPCDGCMAECDEAVYCVRDHVADTELDEAPAFGDFSDHKNYRMPSYIAWHDFVREADMETLWYSQPGQMIGGLLVEHPGIVTLTEDHYAIVHAALERWQATHPGAVPGFQDDLPLPGSRLVLISDGCSGGDKDAILARLLWLDWWMRWALDNCEWPSVYNS